MAVAYEKTVLLRHMKCRQCGIIFAVDEEIMEERERVGGSWQCPNGHGWSYTETENMRLRKQLEAQKHEAALQREYYFAEQRRHEQTTKELKRTKKRVANGVCPCCHRTVSQLARHMKTKHPEFIAETKPA